MHGPEKSDPPIVAGKSANKAAPAAEPMEPRGGIEGKAGLQSTVRTRSRAAVSQAQDRLRQAVARNGKEKLTALLHHVGLDTLRWAFFEQRKDAAPGIDCLAWEEYAVHLETRLADLHDRLHRGAYRALPSRRRYIPKPGGGQRPLGIAALEDKIVQTAVVAVLTPVYEAEFLGFSYGFRPGRGQHDALDALAAGIARKRINRIVDRRIIRLLRKWLQAGVLEDGRVIETVAGTPQGASASPLLANIFLHYASDLWVARWRRRHATGDMIVVRYADDQIVGFEHRRDAERFLADLRERLAPVRRPLHPEKKRLIEVGKGAITARRARGLGRPETFDFLGFTHFCGTRRDGTGFVLGRKPVRRRMRARLRTIGETLRRRMHDDVAAIGRWLGRVVRGWFAYFAVPGSMRWGGGVPALGG